MQATGALAADTPWPFISLLECYTGLQVLEEVWELREATTMIWNGNESGELGTKIIYLVKAWQTSARHQVTSDVLLLPTMWLSYYVKKVASSYVLTHLVESPAMQDTITSEIVGDDSRTRVFATLIAQIFVCDVTRSTNAEGQHNDMMLWTNVQK